MRSMACVLLGCALLCGARSSSASPNYAPELKKLLALTAEPSCEVCHKDQYGGDRTIDKAFGKALQRSGAAGDNDLASLRAAVARSEREQQDSDGDGVADLDELRDGSNPNRSDREPLPPPVGGSGSGGATAGAAGAGGAPPEPEGGAPPAEPSPPRDPVIPNELPSPQTGCALSGPPKMSGVAETLDLSLALLCLGVWISRRARARVGSAD